MLKKDYSNLMIFFLLTLLVTLLLFPTLTMKEVLSSLNVFSTKYFPAVFPIYIISDLLIHYQFPEKMTTKFEFISKKLFHCSGGCLFVLLMSMISGFPSGTKYTKELYDQGFLSIDDANYLITFTHFSNPLFILGTCFLITKNRLLTILILICHFLANFIIAFFTRPKKIEKSTAPLSKPEKTSLIEALSNSIYKTFRLMVIILGTSILFFLLSGILEMLFHSNPYQFIITGLLEVTKGIQSIPSNLSILGQGIFILLFLSFGSCSIHMQVKSILKDSNIKYRYFLLGRMAQSSISILLFLFLRFLI